MIFSAEILLFFSTIAKAMLSKNASFLLKISIKNLHTLFAVSSLNIFW